jgi:hypothetical protein
MAVQEMWSIGIDSLRSPSTGTSNWVPTREFDSETFSPSLPLSILHGLTLIRSLVTVRTQT